MLKTPFSPHKLMTRVRERLDAAVQTDPGRRRNVISESRNTGGKPTHDR